MIGCSSPLPSCSAPGHLTAPAQCRPERATSPKFPLSIRMATIPSQWPCVGYWLKSQGQPGSQLQFLNHGPSMYQSVTVAPLAMGGEILRALVVLHAELGPAQQSGTT